MNIEFEEWQNILLNLSAGLPLERLTDNEIKILRDKFGDNWLDELGYK